MTTIGVSPPLQLPRIATSPGSCETCPPASSTSYVQKAKGLVVFCKCLNAKSWDALREQGVLSTAADLRRSTESFELYAFRH